MDIFYLIYNLISINNISSLLRNSPITYGMVILLFSCLCLLVYVFSRYRIFRFKMLICWLISCGITLIYLAQSYTNEEVLALTLNSQVILSFGSCVMILILSILSIASNKPIKYAKRYRENNLSTKVLSQQVWWAKLFGLISYLAFCCVFNIGLFVLSALFYL